MARGHGAGPWHHRLRLLVDSHVVLWTLTDAQRIPPAPRTEIADLRNTVYVSAASLCEIAIKRNIGKLTAPDDLLARVASRGFDELSVTGQHGWVAGALPLHHRDPFDRLLVAQAQIERLVLVTADRRLATYGVATLW